LGCDGSGDNNEVTDARVVCPARLRGPRVVAWRRVGLAVGPIVLLAWIAVIAAVGWFAVRSTRPAERSGTERAGDVLAERYARGELSTEEYRERRDQLR
jgi:putative membrane protein